MKFSEILNLFRQGKSTAKSHMKNLIEMAAADGNFDEVEYQLLQRIAKRNGISNGQLKSIRNNPDTVAFEVPEDKLERFSQLYDLVHMMIIDNEVHNEEKKLCNLFAIKFGYPRERIEEIISTIQSNIGNGNDHENTLQRVEWMLIS
ncbi:TerB family tellurite resistance protein [Fulvivirga ulvae]|uniref:TerB family tellurite resistance protein n=1 Tax=Fulvivirga ulvae TaxID=2904245 RepID=UPI001F177C42|nr:TerB family tellurite resistance protein [Fulvivirga ulvae]UII30647.1 TerB family tellurite resistance protein [Fulvivirga ulvae]